MISWTEPKIFFVDFFLSPTPTLIGFAGAPMLMDPHPSQHRAGLHHAVCQEVTRPKAWFKPTSPAKSGVDEEQLIFFVVIQSSVMNEQRY